MGTFHVKFTIRNPANPERSLHLEGLVDSGAHLTQVPMTPLEQIGLIPFGTRRVQYADGTVISKPVASAEIQIGDEVTTTLLPCGRPSDPTFHGPFALGGLTL